MYEEELLKVNTIKELIKNSLIKNGTYPEKQYVNSLLSDIDTRYAILNYINVQSGDVLDVDKFNNDLLKLKKDFEILYQIINKISKEKYIELEAQINSHLLSLEEIAEHSEREAQYQFETTSVGGKIIYYTSKLPQHTKQDTTITINLGNISCNKNSKLLCYIYGIGFAQENVEFKIGDQTILPYTVNKEYIKTNNESSKNIYNINIDTNVNNINSYILLDSNVNTNNHYEVYSSKNKICAFNVNGQKLIIYDDKKEFWANDSNTDFNFYLLNGSYINFDFSAEPIIKNFNETSIKNLNKDTIYNFSFTMPQGTCFKFETDCTLYANKESVSISDNKLYLAAFSQAKDFIIYEYENNIPITYDNVTVKIYNVNYENFYIHSIAIKEIRDYDGGLVY